MHVIGSAQGRQLLMCSLFACTFFVRINRALHVCTPPSLAFLMSPVLQQARLQHGSPHDQRFNKTIGTNLH